MKISLLATGGTIASVDSGHGLVPAMPAEKLLEACPLLMGFEHEVEVENIFCKDSSNMNPSDWLEMAEGARRHAKGSDAVVMLHGTDTMAWTASALSFLLGDVKIPVVLTGSMLTPVEPGSDAADNIYAAFQFALQLAMYKRSGVSVAFADQLIHGPRAAKLDSLRKKAFVSVDYPILGEMEDKGSHKVAWLTPRVPKLSAIRPWSAPVFETDIALVTIFPGMKAASLSAVIGGKPKAVVMEVFGRGGVPYLGESLLPPIKEWIEAGIPFVLRSQAPFGGTDLTVYEVGRKALDIGALSALNMTRETLMIKLMLLLPLGVKKLEDRLNAPLCDELD